MLIDMWKATLTVLFTVILGSSYLVYGQGSRMREATTKPIQATPAPAKCLALFRSYITYLNNRDTDLVTDQKSQLRFLSKALRSALADRVKRSGNPGENPDYPRNDTFVGVWSRPTTYSIVASRTYNYRDKKNPDDYRTIIDVLYEWSEKDRSLDNQYPGSKSLFSFIFVFEDGGWKVDDRYTFTDEYSPPESLRAYLESNCR